jgi:DNA helicase HerA-like ATPase
MDEAIGRVIAVASSAVTVELQVGRPGRELVRIGTMVKLLSGESRLLAEVSEVRPNGDSPARNLLIASLLGELTSMCGESRFSRGVSVYPAPGDGAFVVTDDDLSTIYGQPSDASIKVGTLYQDATRPALLVTDELLSRHFAILGATGSGKSCALKLILSAILEGDRKVRAVLLDPHNEYAEAFGDRAEVINVENLRLPFWLFNFQEAARVLVRGGSAGEQESQELILNDAIVWARRHYRGPHQSGTAITVDTPVPFRIHEILGFINEQMGRLGKPDTAIPYLRLKTRIESLRNDRRFKFLFSSEEDVLAKIVGRLLRVPAEGRPLTIVDLSGVPSEIADVIVSTLCRVLFDFSVWCEREKKPPLLVVCEEAHRYVPADERLGFAQTVASITQIAKEGRKYGISLALITQRPSELALSALSQCGTVFALRLGSDADQRFIARTLPDVAGEMLRALPSLPTAQAIVFGEAVRVPMRIRFDDLPKQRRPHTEGAHHSEAGQTDTADRAFIDTGVRRWRAQIRG